MQCLKLQNSNVGRKFQTAGMTILDDKAILEGVGPEEIKMLEFIKLKVLLDLFSYDDPSHPIPYNPSTNSTTVLHPSVDDSFHQKL